MGWKEIRTYTRECGCECVDTEHDVDKPYMCFTDYHTDVTKRCDKHEQERLAKKEHKRKIREERQQLLKVYINNLTNIEHRKHIPIKEALIKYRDCFKISNSDRWILEHIRHHSGDLLLIQKIKNKWVCSEERLRYCDFGFLFDFQSSEIHAILKSS